MCCPYFYPAAPRINGSGPETALLPLGDCWTGECRAPAQTNWQPDDATADSLCNMGYAREQCPRFPAGDGPDAVRFAMCEASPAALRLYYVMERDHHPFAHGPLEYAIASGSLVNSPGGVGLDRQARAYAESYLRRARLAGGRSRNSRK